MAVADDAVDLVVPGRVVDHWQAFANQLATAGTVVPQVTDAQILDVEALQDAMLPTVQLSYLSSVLRPTRRSAPLLLRYHSHGGRAAGRHRLPQGEDCVLEPVDRDTGMSWHSAGRRERRNAIPRWSITWWCS